MGKETWARRLGKDSLPGPADYSTRTEPGCDSPRFTIRNLHPEPVRRIDAPYTSIPTTVGAGPKFTIRPQTGGGPLNDNPGPTYIPHPLGYDYLQRKNGTMRQRDFHLDWRSPTYQSYSQSPFGPAKYDARHNPGDPRDPVFSISPLCGESWLKTNDNPAGAAYRPRFELTKPSSPRHSIHEKVYDREQATTPGPGEYAIPDTFAKRPRSIHGTTYEPKKFQTPGPGRYDLPETMGSGSPRHSIHPLCPRKENIHGVPYRKIPREFDQVKARTIGVKSNDRPSFQTPGPGEYKINDAWNSGRVANLSPRNAKNELRTSFIENWRSPGPAEYDPDAKPTYKSVPAYSLGDAYPSNWQGRDNNVPGPGNYGADLNNPGERRSPRFTIRPKTKDIVPESPTKDAGYYALTDYQYRKPGLSIHPREELDLIPE